MSALLIAVPSEVASRGQRAFSYDLFKAHNLAISSSRCRYHKCTSAVVACFLIKVEQLSVPGIGIKANGFILLLAGKLLNASETPRPDALPLQLRKDGQAIQVYRSSRHRFPNVTQLVIIRRGLSSEREGCDNLSHIKDGIHPFLLSRLTHQVQWVGRNPVGETKT